MGHYRQAGRHRLEDRKRHALAARRRDEDVRSVEDVGNIIPGAKQPDAPGRHGRSHLRTKLFAQLAVPNNEKLRIGVLLRDQTLRSEEVGVGLDRSQSCHGHDYSRRGADAKFASHLHPVPEVRPCRNGDYIGNGDDGYRRVARPVRLGYALSHRNDPVGASA